MANSRRPYDQYTGCYYLVQCGHKRTCAHALTMAALHHLEVKAADVLNTYVMATNWETTWTVLGPEFGYDAGKSATIVKAIYGLKSTGASFWAHLAQCMWELRYHFCDADLDPWMKAEYRTEVKLEYCSYILSYLDVIFCINHDPDHALNKVNGHVPLKPGSVRSPICIWAQS